MSTPSAYAVARPHVAHDPVGVVYVDWLDWDHLQQRSDSLPDTADLVIGLGGGRALDASKFVAIDKQLPLVLVPTVLSTGAIIHGRFSRYEGRRRVMGASPWRNCEYVLVDYEVALASPPHLNTAGLGDILCNYSGIAEWRRNAPRGVGPPLDSEVIERAVAYHDGLAYGFAETLDPNGRMHEQSVNFIVQALRERDLKVLKHPGAINADHFFLRCLELVNDRSWIHGEVVALAALIICFLCDEGGQEFRAMLDRCRVRRRPKEMGISRAELALGLEAIPQYLANESRGRFENSVLMRERVTGARFDELWQFLAA